MQTPTLLAVPNISEGRDGQAIEAIARAGQTDGVRVLDVHSDADHHRAVLTFAGAPRGLADGLLACAREAIARIDVIRAVADAVEERQHPHVGALDVVPLVYLDPGAQGHACAEALVVADRIGAELDVPVFLYGPLTAGDGGHGRTRAQLRRGGVSALSRRLGAAGDGDDRLRPDFGPPRLHSTAGATLVAARPPLVAFNLQLSAPATVEQARAVAARIREGGTHGLAGVRAIGVALRRSGRRGEPVAQVSVNVERPLDVPLAGVVQAVARHAPVASAELVGLAPRAALEGFPEDIALIGFDPARQVIENALRF
jgi:glutamate formiminotransferase / 5-formyltetrahydrofolate cyclo-ligase